MVSTSTANANAKTNSVVSSSSSKQVIRQRLTSILSTNFASTLGQVPDIINLVMALIQRESSFNPASIGIMYGASNQKKYLSYPAIASAYRKASPEEKSNIINAARAYGLMQVTGYYAIRGADPSGKCVLDKTRPDICAPIIVPPGVNVANKMTGENNIDFQIIAGLSVLEDKYKNVAPTLVAKKQYSDLFTASIAAYLGLGASDGLGTTPQSYANSIIRGDAYAKANGGYSRQGNAIANTGNKTDGPVQTAASGQTLSIPGC